MAARGRVTPAKLSAVKQSSTRHEPPKHLSEDESAEWRNIVSSLPASHFRPSDLPLLAEYCVAAATCKRMGQVIKSEGDISLTSRGQLMAHPAHNIISTNRTAMAQIAVKLRLCPSARVRADSAELTKVETSKVKPWDYVGER